MMRLWMQCQQEFDLSPFHLHILDANAASSVESDSSRAIQIAVRRPSKQSDESNSSRSLSPTQMAHTQSSSTQATGTGSRAKQSVQQQTPKPSLTRTTSGNEATRKRPSITTAVSRGKARPSMPRKKSSQSTQIVDPSKPRKSIIKSPQSPNREAEGSESQRDSKTSIMSQMTQSPTTTDLPDRKISMFELPSASSWQSVESHADPFTGPSKNVFVQSPSSPLVDKNFRERFVETQKQLRSTTNLVDMNKAMRKTGSVVRFADEVEASEDLRKLKGAVRTSPFAPRAASEGQQIRNSDQPQSWRQPLPHRDSVGSVAAISDDGSEELGMELPRTKSQLSLAIANLKLSKSAGEAGSLISQAITSPEIEQEQEALISGAAAKKKSEEEEKLLAMAHKGGVTKAGGVNMPKEMTVKGAGFELGSSYESPEEPLF